MRVLRGAAVVTAVIAAACASASGGVSRRVGIFTGTGPGFQRSTGWHVVQNGLSETDAASVATAATVPIARADRPPESAPTHTVASLPRDGILIWVQFEPRGFARIDSHFPPAGLPLRLSEAVLLRGSPEGFQCQRACAVRTVEVSASGYDLGIFIFFGSSHPSHAMRTAADHELARLSLPACPAARPFASSDTAAAARLTLTWARAHYVWRPRDLRGARAVARLVPRHPNGPRLQVVARLCGRRTDRIAAVTITPHGIGRNAVGGNLLYFTAKTRRGWLVWRQG
jgi:hypothetical protein